MQTHSNPPVCQPKHSFSQDSNGTGPQGEPDTAPFNLCDNLFYRGETLVAHRLP